MDYKEMVKRIDEIQMSARDRAAAKAQLAHAERLADWTLATAGGMRRSISIIAAASLRPAIAKIRRSFQRIWAA
jgi:hypothetical protein